MDFTHSTSKAWQFSSLIRYSWLSMKGHFPSAVELTHWVFLIEINISYMNSRWFATKVCFGEDYHRSVAPNQIETCIRKASHHLQEAERKKSLKSSPTTDFGVPLTCLDLSNTGMRRFYAPVELRRYPGMKFLLSEFSCLRGIVEFPGTPFTSLEYPESQKWVKSHLSVKLLGALEEDVSDSSTNLLVFH